MDKMAKYYQYWIVIRDLNRGPMHTITMLHTSIYHGLSELAKRDDRVVEILLPFGVFMDGRHLSSRGVPKPNSTSIESRDVVMALGDDKLTINLVIPSMKKTSRGISE